MPEQQKHDNPRGISLQIPEEWQGLLLVKTSLAACVLVRSQHLYRVPG
jgi:hypothetical protein